jgi:hypothetical protein
MLVSTVDSRCSLSGRTKLPLVAMTDGAILIVKCNRQHSVTGDPNPDSASGEIRKQHMIAAEGSTNASFRET